MEEKLKHSATIIGWINTGKAADCGETMKNQLLIKKMQELGVTCHQIDFKNWKKRPWVFLQFAYTLLFHQRDSLIFSTAAPNISTMIKLFRLLRMKRNMVHWVIGGAFADYIKNRVLDANDFAYISHTIVESEYMRQSLLQSGFKNVLHLPNFKPITYFPQVHSNDRVKRFVFLSRIRPEKGCDYIFQAANMLNEQHYSERFVVDFYGRIADDYKESFDAQISKISNVNYCGFLNLRENSGYDKLAEYDMMLFPTYWKSEGFAGVFVDSFISGVPMIASDWAHNCEFLDDGRTAVIVPTGDVAALAQKMKACIDGEVNIEHLKSECQHEASKYDIDNLVTASLLKKVNIIR
jgi:glycosyltransferase involved in cell wall biosynthesis